MLSGHGGWNRPSEKKACSRLAACVCVETSTLNKGGCGGALLAEQVLDKLFFRPHRNEDLTDCGMIQLVVRSNNSELRTRVPFGIKALRNATRADHRVGLPISPSTACYNRSPSHQEGKTARSRPIPGLLPTARWLAWPQTEDDARDKIVWRERMLLPLCFLPLAE